MIDLITQYHDNPVNKRIIQNAHISRKEGNSICGDSITVYIMITDNLIQDRSYEGDTSMITTAASSLLSELIIGKTIEECLHMTYENTLFPVWFEVTPRRKRAGAIAILATRNGLHSYLWDEHLDTRDNVVEL